MIPADRIADVMGGAEVLHQNVRSFHDLEEVVERGLPKTALRRVGAFMSRPMTKLIYKVVPEGTYKRRRAHLSLEESEKTERLARVIATALYVWDDADQARAFLASPHGLLKDRAPIDVALTELGARQVEELLWQIFHGLPL